jgi:hypothetical protein
MKPVIAAILILSAGFAIAEEKVTYQNWAVVMNGQTGGQTSEAYTIADANSSLGVFCVKDQCIFYLRQGLNCTPGTSYPILMNSASVTACLAMECTLINGNTFNVLKPFNEVLRATQSGDSIGFAVGLQSGTFAASRFSLLGAKSAIERVLIEAAMSKKKKQVAPPKSLPPPKRGSNDLSI